MDFEFTATHKEIRNGVRELCSKFDLDYWRKCDDAHVYPEAFVTAMSEAGWLAALIPQEYGGSGLPMIDAALILEEINHSGGNGAACHAQMYTMASILQHGSEQQKREYLPKIAAGSCVCKPSASPSRTPARTHRRSRPSRSARATGYVINGQKIFTSRFQHSDMILLLARTTPFEQVQEKDRWHEPVSRGSQEGRRRDQGGADRRR